MNAEEWVPFTHRYGLPDYPTLRAWCEVYELQYIEEVWRSRHSLYLVLSASVPNHAAYVDPFFRCTCPGSGLRREDPKVRCAERASQEDRLCDYCRRWCYAVDEQQRQHRFVDLYGAAT